MLNSYLSQLILGLGVTLKVALAALLLGLLLGIMSAVCETSSGKLLKTFFVAFNSVIRGVPELLVIFFIYFGGSQLLNNILHLPISVNSFIVSVLALALIFSAYASQTFRGAFLAVPAGQLEAAKALGMNHWQSFWRILLPQAWRHALPGLSNLWLVLLKDTALVSLIGSSDLMMRAHLAAVNTQKPFTFYFMAALIYLMLTTISEGIIFILSSHVNHYVVTN